MSALSSARGTGIAASAALVAMGCTSSPRTSSAAPVNACPAESCDSYTPAGSAVCVESACVAASSSVSGDVVVTIALPAGVSPAPNRTYAFRLADLDALPTTAQTAVCQNGCVQLPAAALVSGSYDFDNATVENLLMLPSIGTQSSLTSLTSLPVHVTYRPLWPPDAGAATSDAYGEGLPLYPVSSEPSGTGLAPGPGGGPGQGYATYLQPRVAFVRTIAPDAPFDTEFPPDVRIVTASGPNNATDVSTLNLVDFLDEIGNSIPTYFFSSSQQSILGWSAYLRDRSTKETLSPVKTLGAQAGDAGVLLPTHDHLPNGAALNNAELVLAPSDPSLPVQIFPFPNLVFQAAYAPMPPATSVRGSVAYPDGGPPVDTDVVFQATAIYAGANPGASAGSPDGGSTGPLYAPITSFEYALTTTAATDGGSPSYSVARLPRGIYRVILRPHDSSGPSPTLVYSVSIVDGYDTSAGGDAGPGAPSPPPPLALHGATTFSGTVSIADGRALAGALVEAVPLHCAVPATDGGPPPGDTPACMPRQASTYSDVNGVFSLALDDGTYLVRVEPADGTRLPWIWQTLTEPGVSTRSLVVPAPVRLARTIADASGQPIANAVVRVFVIPSNGDPAIEAGDAVTDGTGAFDVYLTPGAGE